MFVSFDISISYLVGSQTSSQVLTLLCYDIPVYLLTGIGINVSLGIENLDEGRENVLTSRKWEESDNGYLCPVLLEDGGGRGAHAAVGPSDILQH